MTLSLSLRRGKCLEEDNKANNGGDAETKAGSDPARTGDDDGAGGRNSLGASGNGHRDESADGSGSGRRSRVLNDGGRGGRDDVDVALRVRLEADVGNLGSLLDDGGGAGARDGDAVSDAGDLGGDGDGDGGVPGGDGGLGGLGDDGGDGVDAGDDGRVLGDVTTADTLEENDSLGDDGLGLTVGVDAGEDVLHEGGVGAEAGGVGVVGAADAEEPGVEARGDNVGAGEGLDGGGGAGDDAGDSGHAGDRGDVGALVRGGGDGSVLGAGDDLGDGADGGGQGHGGGDDDGALLAVGAVGNLGAAVGDGGDDGGEDGGGGEVGGHRGLDLGRSSSLRLRRGLGGLANSSGRLLAASGRARLLGRRGSDGSARDLGDGGRLLLGGRAGLLGRRRGDGGSRNVRNLTGLRNVGDFSGLGSLGNISSLRNVGNLGGSGNVGSLGGSGRRGGGLLGGLGRGGRLGGLAVEPDLGDADTALGLGLVGLLGVDHGDLLGATTLGVLDDGTLGRAGGSVLAQLAVGHVVVELEVGVELGVDLNLVDGEVVVVTAEERVGVLVGTAVTGQLSAAALVILALEALEVEAAIVEEVLLSGKEVREVEASPLLILTPAVVGVIGAGEGVGTPEATKATEAELE